MNGLVGDLGHLGVEAGEFPVVNAFPYALLDNSEQIQGYFVVVGDQTAVEEYNSATEVLLRGDSEPASGIDPAIDRGWHGVGHCSAVIFSLILKTMMETRWDFYNYHWAIPELFYHSSSSYAYTRFYVWICPII